MIFRTIHNRDNPYFQMNRASVNDERLSYKAIGIHTYLMSKPDNWEANETDLTKRHDDGKASVRAGVQELIQFGYMTRVQLRQAKKIVGWRLDTYETPELNPHYTPGKEPGYVVIELDSENQNVATDLDSDFQDVGNQDVGNRNHSNYKNEVNKETTTTPQPKPAPEAKKQSGGSGFPLHRNRQQDTDYARICGKFEDNGFGMLTQMMAEEINALMDEYPTEWIDEAMTIAVTANKRQLRYAKGILNKWKADGKEAPKKVQGTTNWKKAFDESDVPDYIKQMQAGK